MAVWGRLNCVMSALPIALCCTPAEAACRLALVLALDISASVDKREYRLQIEGVAHALDAAEVRELLLKDPGSHIAFSVFEWGSVSHKVIVQPWTVLDSQGAIDAAVDRIRTHSQYRPGFRTAIGAAIDFGGALLAERGNCWRHTIDVSGDGKSNVGDPPAYVRRQPHLSHVTINGLVVTDPGEALSTSTGHIDRNFDLRAYFENQVIWGPDAFTVVAVGYDNYATAMQKKLMRELQVPVFGLLSDPVHVPALQDRR